MVRKIRVIRDKCATIVTELIAVWAVSGRRGCVPDGDGMDGCMRAGNDSFRRDAGIDKGPVVAVEIEVIDDRGVIINLRHLGRCHAIAAWVRVTKMTDRHERETIYAQTKVESKTDVEAPIKEAGAFPIHRKWRQRRPAAVIVGRPPCHP